MEKVLKHMQGDSISTDDEDKEPADVDNLFRKIVNDAWKKADDRQKKKAKKENAKKKVHSYVEKLRKDET